MPKKHAAVGDTKDSEAETSYPFRVSLQRSKVCLSNPSKNVTISEQVTRFLRVGGMARSTVRCHFAWGMPAF